MKETNFKKKLMTVMLVTLSFLTIYNCCLIHQSKNNVLASITIIMVCSVIVGLQISDMHKTYSNQQCFAELEKNDLLFITEDFKGFKIAKVIESINDLKKETTIINFELNNIKYQIEVDSYLKSVKFNEKILFCSAWSAIKKIEKNIEKIDNNPGQNPINREIQEKNIKELSKYLKS